MRSGPFTLGRWQTAEIGACFRSEISGMLWCGGRKKIELSQRSKTPWRGHPFRNDLNWQSCAGVVERMAFSLLGETWRGCISVSREYRFTVEERNTALDLE